MKILNSSVTLKVLNQASGLIRNDKYKNIKDKTFQGNADDIAASHSQCQQLNLKYNDFKSKLFIYYEQIICKDLSDLKDSQPFDADVENDLDNELAKLGPNVEAINEK